tara:strand:- start:285 stop:461 length:177 start_codon:yes stop_codon:yes gene_type:complete
MARSWQQEEKLTVKEINTIMDIVIAKEQRYYPKKSVELKTILAKLGGMAYWLGKNGEL